ncbi:c-type cytochrome [Paraburkholderia rhizosphaerae]|uniref:Cytochrome c553 n=1 Tax=Paraburkholderia rhizosphaerae TaxID=480658 RepID=A0A4R8M3C8_9BURK|nr:c-type cytochrome [Paraburkholderia rhizosphaerae]TDY54928.1 cytochrome c553 [Paraburkholderia rhizosphaerae]
MKNIVKIAALALCCVGASVGMGTRAYADAPTLVVKAGDGEHSFTAADLLARPDNRNVTLTGTVIGDIYHHKVEYHAVPLLALLGNRPESHFDTVELQASDGFVSEIPLKLVERGAKDGAVAWLAVEDPAHPWPALPKETASAGPFYLVWQFPERSGVSREQWPYKVTRIALVESPDHRWPQLAVPAQFAGDAQVKRGHDVFAVQCIACHKMNGGGVGNVGPDLGQPMNVTQYFKDAGLRALIRDPHKVRTWPEQRMIGFQSSVISDADIDALLKYLHAMASAGGTNATSSSSAQ